MKYIEFFPDNSIKIINRWNSIFWYKNSLRHKDNDKPAIEYVDGTKEWYQNGKLIK
jgi:hypothetical protein